jgi:hypothetical protein
VKISTGLTRARRSPAALALGPIPASEVQSEPSQFAELDKHNLAIMCGTANRFGKGRHGPDDQTTDKGRGNGWGTWDGELWLRNIVVPNVPSSLFLTVVVRALEFGSRC